MKRLVPLAILILALIVAAIGISKPWIGAVRETWQTQHGSIKIRIENRAEYCLLLCGAYYIFQSSPPGSDN